jgi:hypothetical protein
MLLNYVRYVNQNSEYFRIKLYSDLKIVFITFTTRTNLILLLVLKHKFIEHFKYFSI